MVAQDGQLNYGPYTSGAELWQDPAYYRAWDPDRVPQANVTMDLPCAFIGSSCLGVPYEPDGRIFEMLDRGEFGLVVLNGARWHNAAALTELQATFGSWMPPLVFCDHEDYPQLRWDFVEAFRPCVYFKRTALCGGHPLANPAGQQWDLHIEPFPFSSAWDIPWTPWKDRDIDLFCVFGAKHPLRQFVKETVERVAARYPELRIVAQVGHPMEHSAYMRALARSRIVVDHQSLGTDTVRFWEAAAAGCAIVSDLHLRIPSPVLVPGCHYYQYANDPSVAANGQKLDDLERILAELLCDPASCARAAQACYAAVRAGHTNESRARRIVSVARGQGARLAALQS